MTNAPSSRPVQRWWSDGLQRGWLPLLPLAFLPLVSGTLPHHRRWGDAAILLASLLAWLTTMGRRAARPSAIALLARPHRDQRMEAWELYLFACVVAVAIVYFALAAGVQDIATNDGAYYYGVARHMALTGRFEEPIVWHFLYLPDRVPHAPFDYWGCLTVLLLVPALVVFGATPATAFLTMAAISTATVLALWYLVCFALPLRYRATQLLALVIFALSPAMDVYRFQPESTAVAQLFLLLALIAFARSRLVLAVLFAFAILLARGDGVILFSLIFVAVLVQGRSDFRRRPRRLFALVLVGVGCVALYSLWSYVSFGTLTPPAPQRLPFLPRYWQVFDFGVPYQPSWGRILTRFTFSELIARSQLAFRTIRAVPFTPAMDWWLAIALLPAYGLCRAERRTESLIWLLCVVGYLLVAYVSGPAFAPFRTPHTFTPLIVLAGALGIDVILRGLHAWMERREPRRIKAVVVGAGVLAGSFFLLAALPVLQAMQAFPPFPAQRELSELDPVLRGQTVASNVPWYVIAYTDSPAVSVPFNGEAALAAVLARYRVRWLLIFGDPPDWVVGKSRQVLQDIIDGRRAGVGPFRLERVEVKSAPAVYRVDPPP